LVVTILTTFGVGLPAHAANREAAGGSAAAERMSADFNKDGFDDLAVGVPGEDLGAATDAGAVHVIYGSPAGLASAGDQVWSQASAGVPDEPEVGDRFGSTLSTGDFDDDGFADLAVGVMPENDRRGAVHVLRGSPSGLTAAGNQIWSLNTAGLLGNGAQAGDEFGRSMSAGYFNDDRYADLAIGAPRDSLSPGVGSRGTVRVLYGSGAGLRAAGNQMLSGQSTGVEDADGYGYALAAANFTGDGPDDLAVGIIYHRTGLGGVAIVRGSATGLRTTGGQVWSQASPGIPGTPEENDHFGAVLAAGDFTGDGRADLAIGVPEEHYAGAEAAGVVHVLYGDPTGLTSLGNQMWGGDHLGVDATLLAHLRVGSTLGAGDFDGDGLAELVIGVAAQHVDGFSGAGAVHVLHGRPAGLSLGDKRTWSEGSPGIHGNPEHGDSLGTAVAAVDVNGDGYDDLAAGMPGEDIGGQPGTEVVAAGAALVIWGSTAGLSAIGNRTYWQDANGYEDESSPGDGFGNSLTGTR
jgi:hypothetical protein